MHCGGRNHAADATSFALCLDGEAINPPEDYVPVADRTDAALFALIPPIGNPALQQEHATGQLLPVLRLFPRWRRPNDEINPCTHVYARSSADSRSSSINRFCRYKIPALGSVTFANRRAELPTKGAIPVLPASVAEVAWQIEHLARAERAAAKSSCESRLSRNDLRSSVGPWPLRRGHFATPP